ncbi:dihydrofolate reductase [Fodinibius sediminis]|uniref:Dihydrofolate reductase n=1 Tax=Fodinibius sediminis TaxID=1214077 RepID=A0A521B6L0_9BACT|nr:dihydrofolate reductase [Fodinibius sediminis]SMO42747.1 dihydrofolate reductase [Fodinibius sediminis]
MTLAAIVAHDPRLVIGSKGGLPWHYSEDLKYFKKITMGHPIIMGRVVFEELNEKPLPGRENIVLSRSKSYDQVPTFSSIEQALAYVANEELVFVIGGAQIYRQLFDKIDKLFVTEIHQSYQGDTFFPEYRQDIGSVWKEIKRDDHPELSFVVYERMAHN